MRDPINVPRVAKKHSQKWMVRPAAQVVAIVVTGPNNYTGIKANKNRRKLGRMREKKIGKKSEEREREL